MHFNIERVKIFVTVPLENVVDVRNAVCEAGAGVIGNYSYCTSSTRSTGTFKPNDKANPYVGKNNNLEFVEEETMEFICDVDKVKKVLTELRKVHPYEEPSIDIFPLMDENFFN